MDKLLRQETPEFLATLSNITGGTIVGVDSTFIASRCLDMMDAPHRGFLIIHYC